MLDVVHAPSELPPQPLLTLPAGQVVHSEHASEPDEVLSSVSSPMAVLVTVIFFGEPTQRLRAAANHGREKCRGSSRQISQVSFEAKVGCGANERSRRREAIQVDIDERSSGGHATGR